MPDAVDHPPHYNAHPSGVECIDVVEHMSFNLGNAIKYIWRADEKGNALEDLRKAAWYVQREVERRRHGRPGCGNHVPAIGGGLLTCTLGAGHAGPHGFGTTNWQEQ